MNERIEKAITESKQFKSACIKVFQEMAKDVTIEDVTENVLKSIYSLMPLPFRLIVKEEKFVQFCLEKPELIVQLFKK